MITSDGRFSRLTLGDNARYVERREWYSTYITEELELNDVEFSVSVFRQSR